MIDWRTVLTSALAGAITAIPVVAALARYAGDWWMVGHKAHFDRELEAYKDTLEQRRKRIDAELGHRIYVGKTQFDTEYGALRDCFAALGRLRLAFNGLRPMLDWLGPPEERTKEIADRLQLFSDRYNPFVDTAASVYPFVPEDIYAEFDTCMKVALLEIRHIQQDPSKALTPSGVNTGYEALQKFDAAYYAAARLARQRFRHLSIVAD
jgi:hypothetical protein